MSDRDVQESSSEVFSQPHDPAQDMILVRQGDIFIPSIQPLRRALDEQDLSDSLRPCDGSQHPMVRTFNITISYETIVKGGRTILHLLKHPGTVWQSRKVKASLCRLGMGNEVVAYSGGMHQTIRFHDILNDGVQSEGHEMRVCHNLQRRPYARPSRTDDQRIEVVRRSISLEEH
jgi:hypothetical protein